MTEKLIARGTFLLSWYGNKRDRGTLCVAKETSLWHDGDIIVNYIIRGLADLKYSVVIGIFAYAIFLLLMYVRKKRKSLSWKCVAELAFCIYIILLIKSVGVFSLQFSFCGIMNYNLIPFVGSSFVPVLLNFILFVPYGILLPLVFTSCKWNWKKILCVGALTSLTIEVLQMFGGRYAEIDDFLINTLGTFAGYFLYDCLRNFRDNAKKKILCLCTLAVALVVCFSGIYLIGDNSQQIPDGFSAAEDNISEIRIYYKGESRVVSVSSDVYNHFNSQISNCGGHLLEVKNDLDSEVMNDTDCFIEILFQEPQTISFENAEDFLISDTNKIIYNADKNILYWGYSEYKYYVDYAKFDMQLEEHRADILTQYQELKEIIIQCFE